MFYKNRNSITPREGKYIFFQDVFKKEVMQISIHPFAVDKICKESNFEIFRHEGLLCCISRLNWAGCLNGYVAVDKSHPFFGKEYGENFLVSDLNAVEFNGNYIGLLCQGGNDTCLLSLDLALNVHGGITYSRNSLYGIADEVFGELWWFGFDTLHAGDLKPFQTEIDLKYPHFDDEYRDFEYVRAQTKSLAEQIAKYSKTL